jgi:beta-glucosidase/6-phospho-beta-glucosidase/beta-galactosidase
MAAHQIEGGQTDGRGSSIWDTFAATPGNIKNAENGLHRLRSLQSLGRRSRPDPRWRV